jgi:hypothetical protein
MSYPPDAVPLKAPPAVNAAQRARIAPAIVRLLSLWTLTKADQLQLLGFPPRHYATLSRLAAGRPFPDNRDQLERASHLLGIYKALRTLYPENPEMVSGWMTFRNGAFGGNKPIEFVKAKGLVGLLLVRVHLERRLHH